MDVKRGFDGVIEMDIYSCQVYSVKIQYWYIL